MTRGVLLYISLLTSVSAFPSDAQQCGVHKMQSSSTEQLSRWSLKQMCQSDSWMCWNYDGKCIKLSSVCDGWKDCLNGEDEWNCEEKEDAPCPQGEVKCGLTTICLPITKHCVGVKDCPGGEDEAGCTPNSNQEVCDVGRLSCDGICKPQYMKCNGIIDCFDKTDEPGPAMCRNLSRVYQVSGIAVTVDHAKYDSIAVKWWMEKLIVSDPIDFLPKLCDIESKSCGYACTWTREMNTVLTSANLNLTIFPFWKYSLSIIVRIGTREYQPGVFKEFLTASGEPGRPYNLEVQQNTTDRILLSWKRPCYVNGHFSLYLVHTDPPFPIKLFASYLPSIVIPIPDELVPLANYTFWVSTLRRSGLDEFNYESKKSSPVHYVQKNVSQIRQGLQVLDVNYTRVTLGWDMLGNLVDNFMVTAAAPEFYHKRIYNNNTKTNGITITGLNPSTEYKVTVSPVYDGVEGLQQSVVITTLGTRPGTVDDLSIICESPTSATLSWNTADHSPNSSYTIFYWKHIEDGDPQVTEVTAKSPILIDGLEPCKIYYFDIFVKWNNAYGPPTHSPKSIMTGMDPMAPPEGVKVRFRPENPMQLVVMWHAACPILQQDLNYTIAYHELTGSNTSFAEVQVVGGNKTKLQWDFPRNYGGTYELKVRTAVAGSRYSEMVHFEDPVIPFVEEVTQLMDTDIVQINFTLPRLPPLVLIRGKHHALVWLSTDITFKDPEVSRKYRTDKNWFRFDTSLFNDTQTYYTAVRVEDGLGYTSPMSEPLLLNINTNISNIGRLLKSIVDLL